MINASKTQCIFIGSRQLISQIPGNITINFDGTSISPSAHVKNLGLHLDRYMMFDTHINELTKKVISMLIFISRVSVNFDKRTTETVVQSLVLSLINYCIRIWGTTNATLIHKVQKLQNFAARVSIGGMKKYDHVSPAFRELKWLRIKQMHFLETNIAIYKSLRGMYPGWLHSFSTVHSVTNTTTRQSNNLSVPKFNTNCGGRAFIVNGPMAWNSLPPEITNRNTLSNFKCKLINDLLTKKINI